MEQSGIIMSPEAWVRKHRPDEPVVFFDPQAVQRGAQAFAAGFPGVVSYAVKANPREEVLANLVAAGVRTFDVASPVEMAAVRALCPQCELHYNNPVRSPAEVAQAVRFGVVSASVDCLTELEKLAPLAGIEVAVRFRLPVAGAAYDFGAKFGASEAEAALLLAEVAQRGFLPSLCFHPGTQCPDPEAWADYIRAAGRIVRAAKVTIARLNVGGGFAADRGQGTPDHPAVFARIAAETKAAFGAFAPQLLCEPGRALAAPAVTLALRVKALRPDGSLVLNDGTYGGLAEWRDMPAGKIRVVRLDAELDPSPTSERVIWGPTCDSLDRLPDPVSLPRDIAEGDYLLLPGMGAYCQSISTQFNGYGPGAPVMASFGSGH